jgi:hypothetical protein
MKKIYLNPATQMHEVYGVVLMQGGSPVDSTININSGAGGPVNGGGTGADPADSL